MRECLTELHIHLDGSLRPQTVWELAKEQGIDFAAEGIDFAKHGLSGSPRNAQELARLLCVPAGCRDLAGYLDCFTVPNLVLQRAGAIERAVFELIEDQQKIGVTYTEIRFAPQKCTEQGLSQDEAVEAVIRGVLRAEAQYPHVMAKLILCCMRGAGLEEENFQTVRTAEKYLGDVVCAIDLAGAEAQFPTEEYAPVFAEARALCIPVTIHAGEAAGPESIRAALSFGAKRIGHGVRAVEDESLVRELVRQGITLEVCPTSNLQTQAKGCAAMEEHPIRQLYDAGVRVTVNSDNRTVSDTDLVKEMRLLKEKCHFTDAELSRMQGYAREARFD